MDGDGEATKGHRDGDTKGHGWGNGDTGTQPGPEVAPWRDGGIFRSRMGTEGPQRDAKDGDTKGHKDGDTEGHRWGYGDTGTRAGLR